MDLELLGTFVAVLQSGGFAKAAARRHITQSTVSQQMKRLAEQAGHTLFTAVGRRRIPTPSAELLFGYAQRLLAMHDDAARALGEGTASDVVRIGATQDFAEVRLPAVLRAFHQSHPRVRLEVRVGSSPVLTRLVEESALDVAVVFAAASDRLATPFARERAGWLAGPDFVPPASGQPWPLALFDAPCVFRGAALQALDAARLPWRIVYSTPSLSGLLAAVRAGLAITLRLARHSQRGLHALAPRDGLPAVASFRVALVTADPASAAARALCAALRADARGRRRR
jgi:DNA-binding transcriptional LysR family regulator